MKVKCPRCGFPGYVRIVVVNGRKYIYVQHWQRKTKATCYIGPEYRVKEMFKSEEEKKRESKPKLVRAIEEIEKMRKLGYLT